MVPVRVAAQQPQQQQQVARGRGRCSSFHKPPNPATPVEPLIFRRTGHTARNRAWLAAMTNRQSLPDGTLSRAEFEWLMMRAELGFGVITTACAHVSKEGQGFDGEVGVWSDHHVQGLRFLAQGLRAKGALGIVQIFHAGMRAPQWLTGEQPLSASANSTDASETGIALEMNEAEIWRVIADFGEAARRCADAGFDGVELHGAHGYLICQFLSSQTNQRRDAWGGHFAKRARFLFEIFRAVKQRVPEDFMVGVRISPEYPGIRIEESVWLAAQLTKVGVDFLHVSCWDVFQRSRTLPNDPRTLTQWFTSSVPNLPPVVTAGKIWSTRDAQHALNQGADFVGVARSAIGNPDWARHLGDPSYEPLYPPYTPDHLRKCGLSDVFVHYMGNWDGFVAK